MGGDNPALWFCSKFIGFQYFFPKTIRYDLRDSQKIQGFALKYKQRLVLDYNYHLTPDVKISPNEYKTV